MDTGSLLKLSLQGIFVLGISVFFLNWLAQKLSKFLSQWKTAECVRPRTEDPDVVREYKLQHNENVERIQKSYNEKSQDFKDRILLPREEAKRRKKEEDYAKFLGPAWKGEGFPLGGEQHSNDSSEEDVPEGRRAAGHRQVPENINLEVARAAEEAAKKKAKPKRVIELPTEPAIDDPDAVSIKLRTPLGTMCSRRFHKENTVQCLLDFITTQGFSQAVYTISTSYPRQILDNPQRCLADLGLGQKMALNIEEKD